MKPWNPHDAKKHKAHALAREIWPWTTKDEKSQMYGWIAKNSGKFGGKTHIREMTMDELSVLIFEMGRLKEHIDRKAEKEPSQRTSKYLKERPWLMRYAR